MPSSPSIGKEYKKYILHGWINKKVSDICLLGRGRVISEIEIIEHSGVYPVYSSQSTNHGEMGRINTYDFDGEYVTWTTDGAYAGSVFYRQGRFNCTNVCGTLKLKDPKYSHRFLAYLLSTHTKKYVSYVGNPKLMNGVVAQIELNIPSSPDEQSKIAEILSTIDEAIEKTDQLIEKYKSIKQGLMEDFFRYGIDENGQIRSEKTHKFKDSQLGRIPLEWEVANFTRILIPQKDAIKIGPFGSQLKKEYLTETGYRVYGQENAFLKTFDIGERFISKDRFKLLKSCELLPGDFIISMMGTIGKCAIIPEGIKAGIMDSHLIRIRIDESKCEWQSTPQDGKWYLHFALRLE